MMKLFEKIFLRLLSESELSGEDLASKIPTKVGKAAAGGLALFYFDFHGITLVLYDPRPIMTAIASIDWGKVKDRGKAKALLNNRMTSSAEESCIGTITIVPPDEEAYGPCSGAAVVSTAAVRQGYGPMMYDVAMYYAQKKGYSGMTSDRMHVSSPAEKLWAGMSKRSDIEKKEFTPYDPDSGEEPNDDDCALHPPHRSALNYLYTKRSTIDPTPLVKRHDELIRFIGSMMTSEKIASDSKDALEDALMMAAEILFDEEYKPVRGLS